MKRLLFLLLLTQTVSAQTPAPVDEGSDRVAGDPFLQKEWLPGKVIFPSGRVLTEFKLKFNIVRNQLLMQFQGSTFAAESKATGFVLYTGSRRKKDSLVFNKGYPETDHANEETFYQVLLQGPAALLQLHLKQVVRNKGVVSSMSSQYYQDLDEFYLFRNGKMVLLPDSEEGIIQLLGDPDGRLSALIDEKKLKFKSPGDYILLINAYNQRKS